MPWRMPLASAYESGHRVGHRRQRQQQHRRHDAGGPITAALFCKLFAGKAPWAHLDIAGVGRTELIDPTAGKAAPGSASACGGVVVASAR